MNDGTGKRSRPLIGLVTVIVIVGFTVGALIGVIGPQMFASSGHTISAVFANAQQLQGGDEVRISGVNVGTVKSVTLDPGGHSSTVQMSVTNDVGPLYANAGATLRWKTLLGSAFYIDLTRGSPSKGPLGSTPISEHHTADQVELDDVLSVDSGSARQGLKTMLPQLAIAMSDPKPMAQTLDAVAQNAHTLAAGLRTLRGLPATEDYDLRSLVSQTAGTLHALNAPDDQLQSLVQGAAGTVSVTAAHAQDLRAALDSATPALTQVKTTFAQLNTTLQLANPLLNRLGSVASGVAPTFAQVRPTLTGANSLLHRATPLLDALPSAMRSLKSASQAGLPLMNNLTPSIDDVANYILPYLNANDPQTQHSTAEMIGPTLEALGPNIAGQEDQNGHFIRFPLSLGNSSLYLPCQTYLNNPSAPQLLACQDVGTALNELLGTKPLGSVTDPNGAPAATTTNPTPSRAPATPTKASTPSPSSAPSQAVSGVTKAVSGATGAAGSSLAGTLANVSSTLSNLLGGKK